MPCNECIEVKQPNHEVEHATQEAMRRIGLKPPVDLYDPSTDHALCKSGRDLAKDLQPVIPGMARAINHQVAAVEIKAIQVNDARIAAYEELLGEINRLLARVALINERQPEYLRMLEALEQERIPKREILAQAAALLGITLDPNTISVASVTAALGQEEDFGPRTVPVPGAPSRAGRIALALTKVFAPLFCGIPISLALGTMTGMIPLSALQDLENLSPTTQTTMICFWLTGVSLHHVVIISGTVIADLHARAKFEGHIPALPKRVSLQCAAWCGTVLLFALWILVSLLEGQGLHQMAMEFSFLGNEEVPPKWVFFAIGGAINGAILVFATYLSYTRGCRELAEKWPWKREVNRRLVLAGDEGEARKSLMKAACELIDLNTKVAQLESKLRADQVALTEKAQVSALALQRIADAEAQVVPEATRLRELLEYVARRMGILAPRIAMGKVDVPLKMILLPFQKMWLHLRGEDHDEWPGA